MKGDGHLSVRTPRKSFACVIKGVMPRARDAYEQLRGRTDAIEVVHRKEGGGYSVAVSIDNDERESPEPSQMAGFFGKPATIS